MNKKFVFAILFLIVSMSFLHMAGFAQADADKVSPDLVYLPIVSNSHPSPFLNTINRQASLNFFNTVYLASPGVNIGWTGDVSSCNAGTTTEAFKNAVALRINYFRVMAGIPGNVTLDPVYSLKSQKAALMMSANQALSHSPPTTWKCYTTDGATAAGSSNLYLGVYSWTAIDGYIMDPGDGNYPVGHRRWILYPQTQKMGSGDIPNTLSNWAANALWVFDDNIWGPRPATREEFVAWPPPGYVPYQVVYPRWSFAYAGADFSSAQVQMSQNGNNLPVSVKPVVNGYGENTLVWEPAKVFGQPSADEVYSVTVKNVMIAGMPREFHYQVIIFDPGATTYQPIGTFITGELGDPPESGELGIMQFH